MATTHLKTASGKRISRASAVPAHVSEPSAPSHEEVEALAYRLYLARGRSDGHDLDDWFEAERLLRKGAIDSVFALYERATA